MLVAEYLHQLVYSFREVCFCFHSLDTISRKKCIRYSWFIRSTFCTIQSIGVVWCILSIRPPSNTYTDASKIKYTIQQHFLIAKVRERRKKWHCNCNGVTLYRLANLMGFVLTATFCLIATPKSFQFLISGWLVGWWCLFSLRSVP